MKRTVLYEQHVAAGGRLVDFAGWEMPVQYAGLLKEHKAASSGAGMFDVSHMGQILARGLDVIGFLNYALTADITEMKDGDVRYSLILNKHGNAIDDLLVYRMDENHFLIVANASNHENVFKQLSSLVTGENLDVSDMSDRYGMIALQGPKAYKILKTLINVPEDMPYYRFVMAEFMKVPVIVSRTGYTGMDGFEIQAHTACEQLWKELMKAGQPFGLVPCGLGVRDLFRIEAGFPLYGHELSEQINPITAGLKWAVKKTDANFVGKTALDGFKREEKRVAFIMDGRAVPRQGYKIISITNEAIMGEVTSGTFSPVLQKPIGMGYISRCNGSWAKVGDKINIEIRGKMAEAVIAKLPFVKSTVYRK